LPYLGLLAHLDVGVPEHSNHGNHEANRVLESHNSGKEDSAKGKDQNGLDMADDLVRDSARLLHHDCRRKIHGRSAAARDDDPPLRMFGSQTLKAEEKKKNQTYQGRGRQRDVQDCVAIVHVVVKDKTDAQHHCGAERTNVVVELDTADLAILHAHCVNLEISFSMDRGREDKQYNLLEARQKDAGDSNKEASRSEVDLGNLGHIGISFPMLLAPSVTVAMATPIVNTEREYFVGRDVSTL